MIAKREVGAIKIRRDAGFTLFEALVSVALMSAIVTSLGAVTGQWLPNWSRSFHRVQRSEMVDVGLQRLAADLEAAEFIAPNSASNAPFFVGDAKSVTFIRLASIPGVASRLEFVRLAEIVDQHGFALVRSHAPFKPIDPTRPIEAQLYFADPVPLVRAPFRVSFAFAGADKIWRDAWDGGASLPSLARIVIRDGTTDRVLAISTTVRVNVDLPAECIAQKSIQQCLAAAGKPTPGQPSRSAAGDAP
jgi:general secretion pathway protein J